MVAVVAAGGLMIHINLRTTESLESQGSMSPHNL